MSGDVDCPVCGETQEINHDDGYGYSEDEMHHQICPHCDAMFGFQTSIHFSYEAHNLPCLNGEGHKYVPTFTVPIEHTSMRCDCGAVRKPTAEEMADVRKSRGYVCSEPLQSS